MHEGLGSELYVYSGHVEGRFYVVTITWTLTRRHDLGAKFSTLFCIDVSLTDASARRIFVLLDIRERSENTEPSTS